jgi:hypothetical protein
LAVPKVVEMFACEISAIALRVAGRPSWGSHVIPSGEVSALYAPVLVAMNSLCVVLYMMDLIPVMTPDGKLLVGTDQVMRSVE